MKSCRLIINKFFYLVVKSWSFSKIFAIILVTFYFSNRQIKKGFTSFCLIHICGVWWWNCIFIFQQLTLYIWWSSICRLIIIFLVRKFVATPRYTTNKSTSNQHEDYNMIPLNSITKIKTGTSTRTSTRTSWISSSWLCFLKYWSYKKYQKK